MTTKIISHGDAARKSLLDGVAMMAEAVAATFGPEGRLAIIEKSFGAPKATKDGVSVAKEIVLEDAAENQGAQLLRAACDRTAGIAGDGTTATAILANVICQEGARCIAAGINPVELKRGIMAAVEVVVQYLKNSSEKVGLDSKEKLTQIATVSANGDHNIGEKIADAVMTVGNKAPITVEEGKTTEIELNIVEGMNFDRGYTSHLFATNAQKLIVEFDNPYICLYDKKISGIQPLVHLLEAVAKAGRSLVLIAEDFDDLANSTLIINKLRGGLNVVAVKAPGFGERRKALLEDIAVLTGGQVISEESGMKLEKATLENLGEAKRIIVTKDDTTIIDGAGSKAAIESRCESIKMQIEDSGKSDYDREKLEERGAKLSGGVAVLRVGGITEVEMKERKDRVEDALHATRAAIEEGVVSGGGVALLRAGKALESLKEDNEDRKAGIGIVHRALQAPIRRILHNAGLEAAVVVNEVLKHSSEKYGYDVRNAVYVDTFEAGILDPAKVVRTSLESAVSVASLVLITEVLIVNKPEDKSAMPSAGGMGGMGGMY